MPHVITQSCCNDASCVFACPVNCIQPTPDDPGYATAEMLHVDASTCVDCGACVAACPVGAIKPDWQLPERERPFLGINEAYFKDRGRPPIQAAPTPRLHLSRRAAAAPAVAIVGSGPAGMYAADELLTIPGARVDIFERLPRPYGLARYGVAPDHRLTRQVTRQLDVIARQPGLTLKLNSTVGVDVSQAELAARYDAVIYAVGSASDRRLDLPGAELGGVSTATEFVAWYNGHPDFRDREFNLSHQRAVVIGNGNVALDVARILTADPARLADTDIAPHALAALRASRVREVVIVGRRGPAESSFTLPELAGAAGAEDARLVTNPGELTGARDEVQRGSVADQKLDVLHGLPSDAPGRPHVRLRYRLTPVRFLGDADGRIERLEFARTPRTPRGEHPDAVTPDSLTPDSLTPDTVTLDAGLVLTSIGYRGVPFPGLPFDPATGTIPNTAGRIRNPLTGAWLAGSYVAGWIKRGPTGFIGTNRTCAQETVRSLVEDFNAGLIGRSLTAA